MTRTRSTLYLILSLLCLSLAIIAILAGCDEKTIDSPILGPASGSGPIGGGETQKIRLTASPSGDIPTIGEEAATATITALVQNNIGQPVTDGTAVYWSTTTGTLNTTSGTTSNGSSAVTLTFPKNHSGCSTVTAESGDAESSIQICTTNSTPTPTVTATPTPATAFIVSSSASTVAHRGKSTITAYAATNGVVDEGLQVNFSVSSGGTLSASAATTDANGNAQVVFTGNNTSSGDITATITATTTDGRSGSTTVIVSSGATPTPTPAPATGISVQAGAANLTSGNTTTVTACTTLGGTIQSGVSIVFTVGGSTGSNITITHPGTSNVTQAANGCTMTTEVIFTAGPTPGTATITAERVDTGDTHSTTVIVN